MRLSLLIILVSALTACSGGSSGSADGQTSNINSNTAPLAVDDNVTVEAGKSQLIDVLSNDLDADGDSIELMSIHQPSSGAAYIDTGVLTASHDDRLVYTPDPGFIGQDVISYTISDGLTGRASGVVNINVISSPEPKNSPKADVAWTTPNTPINIDVLSNDLSDGISELGIASVNAPTAGTVTIEDNGTPDASDDFLKYTPTPGYSGVDSFVYQLTTGQFAVVNVQISADPATPSGEVISGTVMKGPVSGALVRFYIYNADGERISSPIAQTATDDNGQFTALLPTPRQNLLVVTSGGQFNDETQSVSSPADRRVIELQSHEELESILPANANHVAVNVYSNAILRSAILTADPGQFNSQYTQIRNQFTAAMGFDPVVSVTTNPEAPDPTTPVIQRQYAMALGGIAQVLNKVAVDLGEEVMSYPVISGVIDDLSPCLLDGGNESGPVEVLIEGLAQNLPDNIDLNLEIVRFRNNRIDDYSTTSLFQIDTQGCNGDAPPPPANSNRSPTALDIDIADVNENAPAGTLVGTFSTTDVDSDDIHIYNLVSGPGSAGNANFVISGNQLLTNAVFDFEMVDSYSIRVQTDDQSSTPLVLNFIISVNDLNETPTLIELSPDNIDENLAAGTTIGTLAANDDVGDDVTYALVAGPGSDDNINFSIDDEDLRSNFDFDYEAGASYTIRVSADDGISSPLEQIITVYINDINEAPTAIAIDKNDINENSVSGTVIGTFTTTDDDPADSHVYTIMPGPDSSNFNIVGDQLVNTAAFNFEAGTTYSIDVETDDSVTTPFSDTFVISINDVNEAPTAIVIDASDIDENLATGTLIGTFTTSDEDTADSHTYSILPGPDSAAFNIVGNQLFSATVFDFESNPGYSIDVETDDSVTTPFSDTFVISINDINEAPTAIAIDASDIDENLATGTLIGTFTTTDDDPADSHVYTILSGPDSSNFNIVGDQLFSATVFDFESNPGYSIDVETDDSVTTPFSDTFVISINDINEAPTAIAIDASDIDENLATGTLIGTFTTTDDDPADSHVYTILPGPDSSNFNIVGDQLFSAAVFDFESNPGYSIDVETDDSVTTPFSDTFVISINNVNEAPEPQDDTVLTPKDNAIAIFVLANDSDPDSDPLSISAVTSPTGAGGTAVVNDNSTPGDLSDDFIDYTPAVGWEGIDSFSYSVSDGALSTPAMITVKVNELGYAATIVPFDGERSVALAQNVVISFSEAMNASTLDGTTLMLSTSPTGSPAVPAAVNYVAGSMTATIDPVADLEKSKVYFIRISDLIENASGEPQNFVVVTSFTTIFDPNDSDSDGLPDSAEIPGGCPDPSVADSDGDDVGDGVEVAYGGDPCSDQGQTVFFIDIDGPSANWPGATTGLGSYTSGTPGNPNYVLIAEGTYPDQINYSANCDSLVFAGSQDPDNAGMIIRNPDGSPSTTIDMINSLNSEFADCADVVIRDIQLSQGVGNGGTKGGGIRVSGTTTATLESVWITNNSTGDQGGGLGVSNFSVATVRNSVIKGNTVTGGKGGGGVWVGANATLDIADSLVIDNVANSDGGGGLYFDPNSTGIVNNTYIVSNTTTGNALGGGGGIYVIGSGTTNVTVSDSVISANKSDTEGGGIFIRDAGAGIIDVLHNRIVDNLALLGGGVALETAATTLVKNNLILGNNASGGGAGILVNGDTPQLRNNTVLYNRTLQATGAAVTATGGGNPLLRDSILWKNRAGGRNLSSAVTANDNYDITISQSDFNLLEVDKIGASDVDFVNDGVTPDFESGFYLDQLTSTAVETGSDTALFLALNTRFTAAAGPADGGTVDRGFHHNTIAAPPADAYIETHEQFNEVILTDSNVGGNKIMLQIRPLVAGSALGAGHYVVATLEGANTGLAQLSDGAGVDPLSDNESVILSDLGNGEYRAFIEAEAPAGGATTIPLRFYVDELILPVIFNIDRIP